MRFTLGIDEAGRGPLAGPVAVGIVAVPEGFDVAREFPGVKDSKKLSEKKREEIFEMLEKRAERGDVHFTVEFEDAEAIDTEGVAVVIRRAVARGVTVVIRGFRKSPLWGFTKPPECYILLDGALQAPPEYEQETIINGDELVPIISLASVAAKVMRDRLMVECATHYPHYGFERHKGYGTNAHYEALRTHGPCVLHRRSFLH